MSAQKETVRAQCLRFAKYWQPRVECQTSNKNGIAVVIDGKCDVFNTWADVFAAFVAWRQTI